MEFTDSIKAAIATENIPVLEEFLIKTNSKPIIDELILLLLQYKKIDLLQYFVETNSCFERAKWLVNEKTLIDYCEIYNFTIEEYMLIHFTKNGESEILEELLSNKIFINQINIDKIIDLFIEFSMEFDCVLGILMRFVNRDQINKILHANMDLGPCMALYTVVFDRKDELCHIINVYSDNSKISFLNTYFKYCRQYSYINISTIYYIINNFKITSDMRIFADKNKVNTFLEKINSTKRF